MNDKFSVVVTAINEQLKDTDKQRIIVAIDGKSGSGKTTLADKLKEQFDCNVFHMDDFFLRPEQRTKERLAEVGGNVDYERFAVEVLRPVFEGQKICFRPFFCKTMELMDEVQVTWKRLTIIEGSYSMHPYFKDYYDIGIFVTIDDEAQAEVIRKRNGKEMLSRFVDEWIPKENTYFDKFNVIEKSSIVITR